jgi:hypothetical protein
MCLILPLAPSVLQERSSDACLYTRESVCGEAASFKRANQKLRSNADADDIVPKADSGKSVTDRQSIPPERRKIC